MPVAKPARMQIIQAGQKEPSRLSIGSHAARKTAVSANKLVLRNLARDFMCFIWVSRRECIGMCGGGTLEFIGEFLAGITPRGDDRLMQPHQFGLQRRDFLG